MLKLFFPVFCVCALLVGCAAIETQTRPTLPEPVSSLPYRIGESGVFEVDVLLDESGPYTMLIDTGATISSLYDDTIRLLGLPEVTGENIIVHGLSQSSLQPVVRPSQLQLGDIIRTNLRMAVLPEPREAFGPAGVLGMDFLKDYVALFDHETSTLSFYQPEAIKDYPFEGWQRITLSKNPYSERDFNLFFLTIRIGNNTVPAVFDLGASFSLMNWAAANSPEVRLLRRQLRNQWEVNGAVGSFTPSVRVTFDFLRSNRYVWENWTVFVTDLEPLEVMGGNGQPLMVAGADLFRDTSFAMDFTRGLIFIRPSPRHKATP
ncbi:aspartyl protease family protein [Parvularcula sp. IMCC14364]|uniref:aspartyl protease family protein n=1 Tax=Parvularcula sp. IMCC14364 TaxID=3067902 RepID=UPI0027408C79|nr:aspartyl protease family protein [Parvularcula sp. IMCC14364]